jgi:hypothetical protein
MRVQSRLLCLPAHRRLYSYGSARGHWARDTGEGFPLFASIEHQGNTQRIHAYLPNGHKKNTLLRYSRQHNRQR